MIEYQCQLNLTVNNAQCATINLVPDSFPPLAATPDPGNSSRFSFLVPKGYSGGASVYLAKSGCKTIQHRLTFADGYEEPIPVDGSWELEGETLNPSLPPIPDRSRVLGINTSFMGGLIVDSPTYGKMPWWDPALAWCDQRTRELAYQEKVGETHCILEVPSGSPLYDEQNQFYSPDKFPALDWTNGLTNLNEQFNELLLEIISNNYLVHIAMDENYDISIKVIALVARRLKDLGLTKYCVVMPGYDGVFYGWSPDQIAFWGSTARNINPDILLGLEFQPGKLPLGGGVADYSLNGRMKDFDLLLAETEWPPNNTIWGIFGRCLLTYQQPPDQNVDFPPNPFYLIDSARGTRYFCGFETDYPYKWVRINPNDPTQVDNARNELQTIRNYFMNCGSLYNG
jgi:hypothetical protein